MMELSNQRSASEIAAEINQIKAQVRDVAIRASIEIGKRLNEAKALVPYGSWGQWLEENVDYSERKAQEFMAIADEYGRGETRALAEIQNKTQAILLLALDAGERDKFVQEHDMETISTRELEDEIRRLKEENARKQLTIDELLGTPAQPVADPVTMVSSQEVEAAQASAAEADRAAQEAREQLADAKKSLQSAREQVAEAEKRREEDVRREREEAETAKKARDRFKAEKDAESKRADAAELKLKRTEEELRAAREQVRTVEVLPQDVEAELTRLRAQASRSGSESEMRAAYEGLTSAFERLMGKIADAEASDPDVAAKFKPVFHKAMLVMAERVKK